VFPFLTFWCIIITLSRAGFDDDDGDNDDDKKIR